MAYAHNMDEREPSSVLTQKKQPVTVEKLFIPNHLLLIVLCILKPVLTCFLFKKN